MNAQDGRQEKRRFRRCAARYGEKAKQKRKKIRQEQKPAKSKAEARERIAEKSYMKRGVMKNA